MTLDARADRTKLRLKLYENGFSPLANKSKMCLIKGWSTLKVTPELIQSREWARSKAFRDTGIRCGEVIALDWDIDDPKLLNDLLDAVIEQGLVEESPYVRIGRAPRELWVYRTSEKIGKRTTGHFAPPGELFEGSGYAVEILGAGCQFAAYGQRDEDTAYTWPVKSLVDAHYMDLPVITLKQVDALKDFCALFFGLRNLERLSPGGGTDHGYTHSFDLTADMQFEVKDLGVLSVGELTEVLRANPDETLRCRVDPFRPTSGSWAGMASLVNGELCISDHGTYTSHFPSDQDTSAAFTRLGELLAPPIERQEKAAQVADSLSRLGDPIEELDATLSLDENLRRALRRYVWIENDGLVCDLGADFMTQTTQVFHNSKRPFFSVVAGPRGGDQRSELSDLWLQHGGRLAVRSMQMRPDKERPIYVENGAAYVNTYQPVEHAASGGSADIGFQLLTDLLPEPSECAWFKQWLGYKVRNPAVPGPAVVMVAQDSYGTGRGSLISLLSDVFGDQYVSRIDFDTLTGRGHQSQYNEWQSESLIVAVDEAQETTQNVSRWQARNNAYEHLKNVVDPSGRSTLIKRKTVKNSKAMVFASIFIATNHGDAMVIPPEDRRFAVLGNGRPMPPEYWMRFHSWRADPANVAAFVRELRAVDLEGYNPYTAPPMTAAKADMIDAGISDVDRAATFVFSDLPGALMCKDQFILRMTDALISEGYEFPEDWERAAERVFVRKTRRFVGPDRIRIDGKPRTIRMVRACAPEILQAESLMLQEILLNGPVTRQLGRGNVVTFPVAR